MQDALHVPHLI